MPEIWFTYSACKRFTKTKEQIQKFKETGDSKYIYENELNKAWFQHNMAYADFKDLASKQLIIKYYVIKHLILLKSQNMMDINADVLQWFIKFLMKGLWVDS